MSGNKKLNKALHEKRTILTEIESKELLKEAGIPVIKSKLATTKKQAILMGKELGFPIVLKIISPDIVHKSDTGGVRLNIKNAAQLGKAYSEIIASTRKNSPKAKIHGVSVQKMARPGIEIIIGMSKDAQFGPVIMFGLGGILVEILKDVTFRVVPLTNKDARDMIHEVKGYPILEGYRGKEPANVPYLEDTIVKISNFIERHPEIKELDLNPIFAYKDGAVIVDARIILEPEK